MIRGPAVREYFDYRDGRLHWRKTRGKHGVIGRRAGGKGALGYWHIRFFGRLYCEHSLVWVYHNDEWPKLQLDHINRDKLDNRIENLRDVSGEVEIFVVENGES